MQQVSSSRQCVELAGEIYWPLAKVELGKQLVRVTGQDPFLVGQSRVLRGQEVLQEHFVIMTDGAGIFCDESYLPLLQLNGVLRLFRLFALLNKFFKQVVASGNVNLSSLSSLCSRRFTEQVSLKSFFRVNGKSNWS